MNYGRSYSATWRVYRVNRDTWADREQIRNVDLVRVTRTAKGKLIESGSIELTGDFEPDYYRIVMTAEQGGEVERVNVATLLFDTKDGNSDYGRNVQTADGYSVLHPASTTAMIAGEYAPAGVDGAQYAAKLLRETINAPVEVEGSFTLNEHIVHKIGCWVIDAVWSVLEAGGFVMQIDGRGVVHIRPKPTEPSLVLSNNSIRLLTNNVSNTTDLSSIPNRYVVIDENNRTVAENNDPQSEVSTVCRGYCVDRVDESPKPVNGETYGAYAERRLEEESVMKEERSYTREYAPDVYIFSLIRASIDGFEGNYRVTSQTLKCDKGITISEKAEREIKLWRNRIT